MSMNSADIKNKSVEMIWTNDSAKLNTLSGTVGRLIFVDTEDGLGGLYIEDPTEYRRIAVNAAFVERCLQDLVEFTK